MLQKKSENSVKKQRKCQTCTRDISNSIHPLSFDSHCWKPFVGEWRGPSPGQQVWPQNMSTFLLLSPFRRLLQCTATAAAAAAAGISFGLCYFSPGVFRHLNIKIGQDAVFIIIFWSLSQIRLYLRISSKTQNLATFEFSLASIYILQER